MSTTFARRLARRPHQRLYLSTTLLGLGLVVAFLAGAVTGSTGHPGPRPNLSLNTAGVKCVDAHAITNTFSAAVDSATSTTPDYSGVKSFGFHPPTNPADIAPFQALLRDRQSQLTDMANSVDAGRCTDNPTASITNADGKSVTLPVVAGSQPDQPINGSQSNADPRTVPVTAGTTSNSHRTNTWSELNDLYGDQKWYTDCANSNLDMHWGTDVPTYVAAENQHDNRFIIAVNVSGKTTDDQIRKQAADDGNPNVSMLPIVRTPSIINTRHLADNRCDQVIDTRSMTRVSLGKVVFDDKGNFKKLELDKGAFVDCHNLWQLPKSQPVPVTPTPKPTPSLTHPPTTPPTTPPSTHSCTNGGTPPECLQSKDPTKECEVTGQCPTHVAGTVGPDSPEPQPTHPPASYSAPPRPIQTTPAPPRTTPPPESPAPRPSDPATGTACPPGVC